MILIYECAQTLASYAKQGRNNHFPDFHQCPACKAQNRLKRHGFYERNALEDGVSYRIPICRLKCRSCNQTFSLLPDFLIPYFQYTLSFVMKRLKERLVQAKTPMNERIRQLIRFYVKRFCSQLTQVIMFFRHQGWKEKIPDDEKAKAINLLEMISAFGEAPFLRRSRGHFQRSFMAK
ncbi:DUF6431 domain-containing protein [Microaerobacter geothermalis]|uniref:DUF6431 domain-containing protein n=1 Tax=Microaerobacter geothermalis TaxID=674972 RepID=UPI001F40559C|nr:DUF6431 domain-containing protein [Microaerobacter geothermalis]MCF6094017.1 DUF6431 domain-containing protein [Microaerobacter geothermalis]